MDSDDLYHRRNRSTPQAIPLQDFNQPRDEATEEVLESPSHRRTLSDRGRSLFRSTRNSVSRRQPPALRYTPIDEDATMVGASAQPRSERGIGLGLDTDLSRPQASVRHDEDSRLSPIGAGFQEAMNFVGISFPGMSSSPSPSRRNSRHNLNIPTLRTVPAEDDETASLVQDDEMDDGTDAFPSMHDESDEMPLTENGRLAAPPALSPSTPSGQRHDRHNRSFGSLRFLSPSAHQDGFPDAEAGTLTPESALSRGKSSRHRSPSPGSSIESPLRRAGTVMRHMSQRVVNISNEQDVVERSIKRTPSLTDVSEHGPDHEIPADREPSPQRVRVTDFADQIDGATTYKSPKVEKAELPGDEPALPPRPPGFAQTTPLRGKSLGVFPPDSPLRLRLCDLLTHPFTEPFILFLIVVQTIVLAVDAGTPAFQGQRPIKWGYNWIDYAELILFIIYTVELIIRTLVSGFVVNPIEYSTINRAIGFRKAVALKANDLFALQRKPSLNTEARAALSPPQPSLLHTLTSQGMEEGPRDSRQAQRKRLAHRAFLRHSFNRLDFLAVTSFWISFWIALFGVESRQHLYVFKMLSCLRILRLLGITGGTSVILRSLKRAMPSLLKVAFLIGFFWLLFAIIGVQSFKSSLRRTCMFIEPGNPDNNFTENTVGAQGALQFCGGWIAPNGSAMPYLKPDLTWGSDEPKGYWCPMYSQCIEGDNPYNGTVSFDNLVQSLEQVFIIMSSNTFSDIMYYLMDSEYMVSALFFAFGIVIMTFWMANLLIAVITSSFQIIREESKASAFAAEQRTDSGFEKHEMNEKAKKRNSLQRAFKKTKWFWIAVIVTDLLAQCFRSAIMSDTRAAIITIVTLVVTIILDVEILIRFIIDFRGFFKKKLNVVDLLIAIITTVVQILPYFGATGIYTQWLSVFQTLRIYRVVLALTITRELILIVLGNFSGLANLILFVFLLTFLAAIFAAQLFRGELPLEDSQQNYLYVTFFNIWNSFLGMYQILSSENWTSTLYAVTGQQTSNNNGWIGAAFLILWYILANFIVLNMFIAVIQENFDVSEDEKRLQQVRAFLQKKQFSTAGTGQLSLSTIFKFGQVRRQDPLDFGEAATAQLLNQAVVDDFLEDQDEGSNTPATAQPNSATTTTRQSKLFPGKGPPVKSWFSKLKGRIMNPEPNPFHSGLSLSTAYYDLDPRDMAKEVVLASERQKREQRDFLRKHPSYNTSLFIFKPNNRFRRICQKIVGPGRGEDRIEGAAPSIPIWYAFSAFIYAAIVAMVVLACVTTPVYQRNYFLQHGLSRFNWFVLSDIGFAALFSTEAIIKVIADGFFFTPNAYFRSSWGFIDGVVLLTLWINVIALLKSPGGGSRVVGAFKALRALRLLNVSDSARDTFHAVIIMGGWKVTSAMFVSITLLIPFAIYGLNLFNGQMLTCNDRFSGIYNLTDCVGEYNSTPFGWDVLAPRKVANSYYNFDDFGSSLSILFQIVSQEGWVDVMNSAQSITGRFTQYSPFVSQGNAVFFIVFNLLGAVFVLTLFVSVFMRNYTEQTGVAFLTTDQRSWLELRKLLRQVSPSKRPSSKKQRENWKEWCYKRAVKKNGRWQRSITGLLILHLILLCLEWYPDDTNWLSLRDWIFLGLTCVFISNIIIRIIGLSFGRFRRSAWDVYSVMSVSGAFVSTLLTLGDPYRRNYIQVHKLFLVSVALLLIPRNNQLDQLFKTAAASLTAIANLLATWFVLFLVFAIAMTQTFGLTRFNKNETDNINFRSVPKALILLFRTSVGEGWNQLMYDFETVIPPYCTVGNEYYDGDCGSPAWASALFIAWNLFSMYIFVNLFVSLIYESFSYVYQRSSGLSVISREEIRRFKQAWAEFDPEGTGYITKEAFPRLLGELSGVFEMRIYDGDFSVRNILDDCQVNVNRSTINFDAPSTSERPQIDLRKLNQRLNELPIAEIRKRRQRMNTFYEEVLVSADPDRGIEFNSLLMILAHYKVINDNKSLRLEEFLRRRARLQRVDEAVRRNIVVGFFDTLYWSRRFRRRLDARKSARMTAVPSLDFEVPEIFVQDESESPHAADAAGISPNTPRDPTSPMSGQHNWSSPHGSATGTIRSTGSELRDPSPGPSSGSGRGGLRNRSDSIQISPSASPTRNRFPSVRLPSNPGATPGHSPNPSSASASGAHREDWRFASALNRPPSPGHLAATGDGSSDGGGGRSRANSSVSAQDVMDSLDNSAWGESIRRSFTLRRPSDVGSNEGFVGGAKGRSSNTLHRR